MTGVRRRPRGVLPTKQEPDYGSVRVLPGGGLGVVALGRAAPQGSKNPSGGEANWRTGPWRGAVMKVLEELPAGWEPLDGPLAVDMTFLFEPPKSAKRGDLPTTKFTYDIDKLVRAMHDALGLGGAIKDDARVVDLAARKRYVWPEEGEPRAVITVTAAR